MRIVKIRKTMARVEPRRLKLIPRGFSEAGVLSVPDDRDFLSERTAVVKRETRDLIFEVMFLRKSNHGGGDQENEPTSFERMPSTALNKALIRFTIYLPKVRILVNILSKKNA
jgi:hypothetical protein